MMELTIIMAYYENPGMLQLQMSEWAKYSLMQKTWVKFIIVDDGSQESPAINAALMAGYADLDIQIYRVLEDRPWGQDGARNIGMARAQTDWVLLTDMDHMLEASQVDKVLAFVPNRKEYYMPRRMWDGGSKHAHPNSYLIHRHDFWRMGGYDEDFVGWYGSDGNFRKCAKGSGLIEVPTDAFYLYEFNEHQVIDANTRKYQRKDGQHYAPLNPALEAKRRGPAYRASNPFRLAYERVL